LGARPGERITRSRLPFWTHLRAEPSRRFHGRRWRPRVGRPARATGLV